VPVKVFVVGHDWGAIVAWNLCLLRPDRVRALVNLSVAFMPRNPSIKPIDYFRRAYGDDYYVCRFQVRNLLLPYQAWAIQQLQLYIPVGCCCRSLCASTNCQNMFKSEHHSENWLQIAVPFGMDGVGLL
jgi:pimeloyl-ACP methyl ester carboxylesterase